MAKKPVLVVMAAGMGSRYGGLKQIDPVGNCGEAILDFSVYDAHEAGFETVVIIIKEAIRKDFMETVGARLAKAPVEIRYAYQELDHLPEGYAVPEGRTKPWGTSHAVLCAKEAVDGAPFAVINADDFYGKTAFQKIYNYLKEQTENYCMVGFRLANTLTENGSVSRGVCSEEDGFLKDITERTKIIDCKYILDDETWHPLAPDTVVSMNMWGFTTDIFKYLEREFNLFLEEFINKEKSEFYLPSVVDTLIKSGEKKAKVLVAEEKWYGVTYKEDKEAVVNAISQMEQNGLYPNM